MAEANEAEPNESTAPSPRRPRRKHQINLCCAQSVQVIVEEVSRNLRGLGFRVSVVCGAEARAALLGSQANSDEPTIHVVCVQGSLQERVLKPLRQALATHGGPNQHLFVAVLDLGVPLAMVGQIRRFAEALERPTTTSSVKPDGTVERRAWREHSGQLDRPPARSLPSVMQVVERPGTVPPQPQEGSPRPRRRTRTKTLTSRGRAVKIGPTSKYQAVTASHPAVPTAEPGVNKRRRERSAANPQRRPTGSNPRVLDLPDSEASRPPPVPTPSELARRRSGTLPAVTPGAPPVRRRPDSTAPGFEQAVTQAHKPWRPAAAESVPERDAATPRGPGIRFTPPGVSAAKGTRTPSGRFIPVPTAGDPDKTVVQGLVDQTPKTASTLRLDEPPFKAERSDKTTLYNNGPVTSDGEPVEPTVIEPPPTGPRATKSKKTAAELSSHADPLPPAVTGHTVVGPPPEPPPEVLAELERARQQAKSTSDTQSDEDAITVPPAGATVKDEDADARADDDDDEGDEPKAPGPPPSSTTTLPGESNPTAPNSDDGTLVVPAPGDPSASASGTVQSLAGGDGSGARVSKPRQTVLYVERAMARDEAEAAEAEAGSDAAPAAVAAAAVGAAAVAKAAKASSAASKSTGKTTTPEASESTPTLLSRPRPAASEDDRSNEDISESDKTLLRADGTFEDASALMKKVEAAQAATRAAGEDGPARIVVDLDPEDRHDDAADGSSKTVVFNRGDDETSAKDDDETRDSGGTVVAAAAAIAAESARRVTGKDPDDKADAGQDDSAAAASGSSKTEPASGKTEPSKTKAASSTAGSSKTESSKTEAASSTAGSSKSEPSKTEPSGNTVVAAAPGGSTETRAKRSRKGRGRNNGRGAPRTGRRRPPSTPTDKPRTKTAVAASKPAPTPIAEPESSRRGWVWLLILLLVGGGVWLAYERGLLDSILGRDPSSTVANRGAASTPRGASADGGSAADGDNAAASATASASDSSVPAAATRGSSADAATQGTATTDGATAAGGTASDGGTTASTPPTDGGSATGDSGGTADPESSGTTGDEPGDPSTGSDPAGTDPPGTDPPGTDPPGTDPAGTDPPGTDPAGTDPPGTDPAGTDPPGTDPPGTDPPGTDPPGTDPDPTSPESRLTPDERVLAKAADQREVYMLKTVFASRRQGTPTSWSGAAQRCAALEVEGIKGWRVPHRREMKLLNAVLPLAQGIYWTKTVPKDDRQAAYVLDTATGGLSLFLKAEPTGDVICVRRRAFPDK